MATIRLPPDFKEFLKLLKEYDVRYLLIGAYAVNYHGYIRATGDGASSELRVLEELGVLFVPDLYYNQLLIISTLHI